MALKSFLDQTGVDISLSFPPRRIVSLVPSQTELLFDLGLTDEVIGVTRFCIHPERARKEKVIIGGTKQFDIDKIVELAPDLIIGNKEENYREGIEILRAHFPVWMSDIYSVEDGIETIIQIGELTNRATVSKLLAHSIRNAFSEIPVRTSRSALYMIWKKPWMAAGGNTFIGDMLERFGLQNVLDPDTRYPELTDEIIVRLNPGIIFLSSEPYPFKEKHKAELLALCPYAEVILVDGEMFSWYGSRMLHAPGYFKTLNLL